MLFNPDFQQYTIYAFILLNNLKRRERRNTFVAHTAGVAGLKKITDKLLPRHVNTYAKINNTSTYQIGYDECWFTFKHIYSICLTSNRPMSKLDVFLMIDRGQFHPVSSPVKIIFLRPIKVNGNVTFRSITPACDSTENCATNKLVPIKH